ncbi:hypothetical protein G6F37_011151 [Rhizopus arrhizus]|nr:hypothetical protein G6F38_010399 [Rhizopus arrhizus]KAG1150658.1 hypothetical protein G6F37_011151 [Rhizopus arrhizus]
MQHVFITVEIRLEYNTPELHLGKTISPVLFNLAFEPLLRRFLSSPHISGFQLPRSICSPPDLESRSKVKLLAYADDVVCFLNDPYELNILHEHLNLYAKASNAKVNFNKTEAVSLSGSRLCYQRIWRTPLLQQQIHSWHDSSSREPVIYLGFPLHSSIAQRDTYLTSLLSKITTGVQLHSHRSLSVRGRVTILNSLIPSKLWHVLRILSVPKLFFKRLKSQISGFVSAKRSPRVSFETMCFPRNKGGLGVLNPHIQQSALQLLEPSFVTIVRCIASARRSSLEAFLTSWVPSAYTFGLSPGVCFSFLTT